MAKLKLTMALSHYDRHFPFFDGSVSIDGVDLNALLVGQSEPLKHGVDRHERMLQKGEFDVCELSLSSYLMARSRGMPFTAIPVFPRRLFSMSQMWVRADAGINRPGDLIGRKVGLSTFQTTLSVRQGRSANRVRRRLARDRMGRRQRRNGPVPAAGRRENSSRAAGKKDGEPVGSGRDRRALHAAPAERSLARLG
jgi:hypothetical protein